MFFKVTLIHKDGTKKSCVLPEEELEEVLKFVRGEREFMYLNFIGIVDWDDVVEFRFRKVDKESIAIDFDPNELTSEVGTKYAVCKENEDG